MAAVTSDSLKNWLINCPRNEPMALRMPTSLARFSLRAVLRFIKLIQASNKTKPPTREKIHTYCMAPPELTPSLNSEYKCHLLIGCKSICGFSSFAVCGSIFLSFTSLIFADTLAISAWSASCTNSWKDSLYQLFSLPVTQFVRSRKGAIKDTSLNELFFGRSSYTPATFSITCPSIFTIFPIGSSLPKIALAVDCDNRMEECALNPSREPASIVRLSIFGASVSI